MFIYRTLLLLLFSVQWVSADFAARQKLLAVWTCRRCWFLLPNLFYAIITRHCRQRHYVFGLSSTVYVHPFVWTDFVTTISHERLEPSRWNLWGIFASLYWWPPESILEVKGQGHSRPLRWWSYPRRPWGVEIHLPVHYQCLLKVLHMKATGYCCHRIFYQLLAQ